MRKTTIIGLAGTMALSATAPVLAQGYSPSPYQPTPGYERDLRRYEAARTDYEAKRIDYEAARRDYERRRDDYERARIDYDRRYGYGAYARLYGPAPIWDEARWADRYGRDAAYVAGDPCRRDRSNSAVAGGLIGAIAGAALGSNVAARNARTEGAVLGGVLGAAAGVGIGRASAKCDDRGYWFSYNETVPYRESRYDRRSRSGRYDYNYYVRERCRLAPAPVDWGDRVEYRYVRVCPDRAGRYRVTG